MTVNVLGEEWEIIESDPVKHPMLKKCDGYCDYTSQKIIVHPMTKERDDVDLEEPRIANDRVLRHELIHAFLYESGLADDAEWPKNEAMVDWFARQFPKLYYVFYDMKLV